jgi:hypothetical protein
MIYNKEEIREWINQTETVDSSWEDDDGNELEQRIVKKDGELFLIEFCNRTISERWGEKGFARGEYEPIKMFDKGLQKKPISYIEVKQVYECEDGEAIKFYRSPEAAE